METLELQNQDRKPQDSPPPRLQSRADFFAKYPRLKLATEADNEALQRFFNETAMAADSLSLRFERAPDFFKCLQTHSEKFDVMIFKNDDGSIGGVASLCFRRNYLDGKLVNAAYLGDLRLSPHMSRETRRQWRSFYSDFLISTRDFPEWNNCRYFYSVVLDENKAAIAALTRKKGSIVYRPLAHYQTITLLARWPRPFAKAKCPFHIRRANDSDKEALRAFLESQHRQKLFGQYFEAGSQMDELSRRLQTWDEFDITSFLLAVDNQGLIQACSCPWQGASYSRQLRVDRMPLAMRIFGKILPLFGKKSITPGAELKVLYLTQLEFNSQFTTQEKSDILSDFLMSIYRSGIVKNFHLVSFFDYSNESLISAVKGYAYQLTPATLYQVMQADFVSADAVPAVQGRELPGLDIATA